MIAMVVDGMPGQQRTKAVRSGQGGGSLSEERVRDTTGALTGFAGLDSGAPDCPVQVPFLF